MTTEEAVEIIKEWLMEGTDGLTKDSLGYIEGWFHKEDAEAFDMAIKALEQEPKTGHWINGDSTCPCCGESKFKDLDADIWADWKPKYCPNCGAKMVEPQNLKYADNDTMMPAT